MPESSPDEEMRMALGLRPPALELALLVAEVKELDAIETQATNRHDGSHHAQTQRVLDAARDVARAASNPGGR